MRTCFGVFADLLEVGVQKDIAMMGVSAGCDQLLSIVAVFAEYGAGFSGRFAFITLIAGAWHPTLYPQARDVLLRHDTCVLVHHPPGDKLWPWEKVDAFLGDVPAAARPRTPW